MTRFMPDRIGEFIRHESAGGMLLVAVALLALIIDNSPLAWIYDAFRNAPVSVRVGPLAIDKPLLLWINDGLMAIFFLLVGLELKRELLEGELATWQQAALPAVAAVGGMVVPAAIYAALNFGNPVAMRGWAIPTATDIAFAMGVLALLGDRVPPALKVFLLALAIIDDLGAILVIAVFYSDQLSAQALAMAAPIIAGLFLLNRFRVQRRAAYLLLGLALWVCVLKSGVHATLAGVATAFAIPLRAGASGGQSPLLELEHALHPWVAFAILPLFAFANAGVSLDGLNLGLFLHPMTLGIALGLFLGKQSGVLAATWLAIRCGVGRLPEGTNWGHIYGAALVAGIGFTMSLFIGTLAFHGPEEAAYVRLGVLAGSFASAVAGYAVLRLSVARPRPDGRAGEAD